MDRELIGMLLEPDAYECFWHDGELYIRPAAQADKTGRSRSPVAYRARSTADLPMQGPRLPEAHAREAVCD